MSTYQVDVSGCDDNTVIDIEATEAEAMFLKRLAEKVNDTSTYLCMPRIYVKGLVERET